MHFNFFQNLVDIIRGKTQIALIENYERELKKKNTIKVIGDSHCNFFSGNQYILFKPITKMGINNCNDRLKNFTTFHLGPALAFNMNKYNTKTKAREKAEYLIKKGFIPENSTVICCFGEIDLRVHVIKQSQKQHKTYQEIIDNIIDNYLEFLLFLKQTNKVFAWGPIATVKDGISNEEYPTFGEEVERNKATEYFNNKLEQVCKENEIGFLSIFKYLIDDNYRTNIDFISDDCHLAQTAWLFAKKELIKNNLIAENDYI